MMIWKTHNIHIVDGIDERKVTGKVMILVFIVIVVSVVTVVNRIIMWLLLSLLLFKMQQTLGRRRR